MGHRQYAVAVFADRRRRGDQRQSADRHGTQIDQRDGFRGRVKRRAKNGADDRLGLLSFRRSCRRTNGDHQRRLEALSIHAAGDKSDGEFERGEFHRRTAGSSAAHRASAEALTRQLHLNKEKASHRRGFFYISTTGRSKKDEIRTKRSYCSCRKSGVTGSAPVKKMLIRWELRSWDQFGKSEM